MSVLACEKLSPWCCTVASCSNMNKETGNKQVSEIRFFEIVKDCGNYRLAQTADTIDDSYLRMHRAKDWEVEACKLVNMAPFYGKKSVVLPM